MTIAEFKSANPAAVESLQQTNLVFLRREGEVLLAMKKRGFGAGRWNGAGGKVQSGETMASAAIRETQEEIGVKVNTLKEVGIHKFYFATDPSDPIQNIICTVYVCDDWDGEPEESEEMAPKWYKTDEIPYDEMWPDDRFWCPQMLEGGYVTGEFLFGEGDEILDMDVKVAEP